MGEGAEYEIILEGLYTCSAQNAPNNLDSSNPVILQPTAVKKSTVFHILNQQMH
jgi:hypothetical protein